MSDRDVTALLDRLAARTPHMDVSVPDTVRTGRRRVRTRRAAGLGLPVAALALVGALWVGGDGGPGPLGTQQVTPASVTWEVDEPVEVTLLDGVTQGGEVAPLSVRKTPDGSVATFTDGGEVRSVPGRVLPGGVEVFVGEQATVMVWASQGKDVWSTPVPEPPGGGAQSWATVKAGGERLSYWYGVGSPGYVPEDVVFQDGRRVWAASGSVADVAALEGSVSGQLAFDLPELGLAGLLDGQSLVVLDEGEWFGGGETEPWWRGSDTHETLIVRLPAEATAARLVWRDETRAATSPGEPVGVTRAGDAVFAHLRLPGRGQVERWRLAPDAQWSTDGTTWQDTPGTVPPGSTFDGVSFSVREDGSLVAERSGRPLQLHDELRAFDGVRAWDDSDRTIFLVDAVSPSVRPVVRTPEGEVRGPGEDVRVDSDVVDVGGTVMTAGSVEGDVLGATTLVGEAGDRRWDLVPAGTADRYELDVLDVVVDEEQGLWLAAPHRHPSRWGSTDLVVSGAVGGRGVVVPVDPDRARVAIVTVEEGRLEDGRLAPTPARTPVLGDGASFISSAGVGTGGEPSTGGARPGVVIQVTHVQCLVGAQDCVLGLDTDGDGLVDADVRPATEYERTVDDDLPQEGHPLRVAGEPLTLLGRDYTVVDAPSGWPRLRSEGLGDHVMEAQEEIATATPIDGRFPWSRDGTAVWLPGTVLSDVLRPVVESGGEWVEPDEVVVVQSTSASATLLAFDGVDVRGWSRVGVLGPDGQVEELPLP